MIFTAVIRARKNGSIGSMYHERREFIISAEDRDEALNKAIELGHEEGLEHVLVTVLHEESK